MTPPRAPARISMWAVTTALVLAACSGEDDTRPPPGDPCAAGTVADDKGACIPVVCGPGERKDQEAGGTCKPLGWQACGSGFAPDASGHGCRDVLPARECGPGTMPVLGQTACQPVGPETCAAGFERDETGWGCRAVVPTTACASATKETLGSVSCTPVGDCTAAFPPAGATVFVNAAFTAGQLDAAHVRTLAQGLAAASTNGVIAVETGTYTETLAPVRSVRIVGRCAGRVTLASPGGEAAGITATGPVDVTVEGVTIAGHVVGVAATAKASITLREAVLAGNRGGGVSARGAGTRATIERSVVRSTVAVPAGRGIGIETSGGAELVLLDSVLADNVDTALLVAGSTARARVERSVIVATRPNASGDFGLGVMTRDGAHSEISATAFAGHHEAAVASFGKDTLVNLTDVAITDTSPSAGASYGWGVLVNTGVMELERVTVTASHDAGFQVEHGGTLRAHAALVRDTKSAKDVESGYGVGIGTGGAATLEASAFIANTAVGLLAVGPKAKLTMVGSLVASTAPDVDGARGYGVEAELGATAEIRGSALVANTGAGLYASDAPTQVSLTDSVVSATRASRKRSGRGVTIELGATASLLRSAVVDNREIGVSARGSGTSVTIEESVVRGTLPQELDGRRGRGVEADDGAKVALARVSLLGNHCVSVLASTRSIVDVRDSWVADTLADSSPSAPGVAVAAQSEATMNLLGVVVERSTQAALVASYDGSVFVRSSLVQDTALTRDGTFGHGLLAFEGALLVVDDVTLRTSAGAGLVFAASRGSVSHTRILENSVGIHVQDGSTLTEVASVPEDPAESSVSVSLDTTFDGNGTRAGSGALPIPDILD